MQPAQQRPWITEAVPRRSKPREHGGIGHGPGQRTQQELDGIIASLELTQGIAKANRDSLGQLHTSTLPTRRVEGLPRNAQTEVVEKGDHLLKAKTKDRAENLQVVGAHRHHATVEVLSRDLDHIEIPRDEVPLGTDHLG